jgi:hypothetical protein
MQNRSVAYLREVPLPMLRKRELQKKPWRLHVPAEVSRPKGSREAFLRAIEELAPYRGIWVKEDGSRRKLSKKVAIQLVSGVARRFNFNEYVARDAPRFSEVVKRLKRFERLSAELAEHIEGLDDLTLRMLQLGFAGPHGKDRLRKLMEDADVQALSHPHGKRSPWARRLFSLSKCANLSLQRQVQRREQQGRSISDRGGRTNMFKEDEGIPRWRLVTDLLYIHQTFKPSVATSTEGGPFHRFVLNVFEYATGKEGEVFAKVEYWIKRLVKATRDEEALRLRANAMRDDLEKMASDNDDSEEALKKFVAVIREVRTISAEREKLWAITWPHYKMNNLWA